MKDKSVIKDLELIKRLNKGDKSAFEYLYDRYHQPLYLHAYSKLRDRELARDVVHDLFSVLWEKRENIRINTQLSSYLYTSVRNRVIDHIVKEQSKRQYLLSLNEYLEAKHSITDHLVREKMLSEQIENVVANLPPRLKQVFEMSRKQFLSHREISQRLNLSEQSVKSYMKDALRVLRARFSLIPWLAILAWTKIF